MAVQKNKSYNNLIDLCIEYELDPDYVGNAYEIFKKLLSEYFFMKESQMSKGMEQVFNEVEAPSFLKSINSMYKIDIEILSDSINGESINQSLCGRIMMSKAFLKVYYPNQTPSFNSMAEDIKFELIGKIKTMNKTIIDAFEKMKTDRQADKSRKVITLISLILKNIHMKTGRPLLNLTKPAEDIIGEIFRDVDNRFTANSKQMSNLSDDSKIKNLIKSFFFIKQFKDIEEVVRIYKIELERFRKRSQWSV